MSYHSWHVGMKVVCVDAGQTRKYDPRDYRSLGGDLDGLTEGHVYTVRDVVDFYGVVCVRLQEIVRGHTRKGIETPFAAARFRPVQTRKTDISIFTAMLHDKRQKVPS